LHGLEKRRLTLAAFAFLLSNITAVFGHALRAISPEPTAPLRR
jgi:hypothetical protein